MAQIKLGELLIKAGVLQEGQLRVALAEQQRWGGKLGDILVRMNLVTEDLLVRALSRQLSLPAVNLDAVQDIQPAVRSRVPLHLVRAYNVLPLQLRDEGKTLVVAMADPLNGHQLDDLRSVTGCRIVAQVAGRTALARAFARFYEERMEAGDEPESFKRMDAQGRSIPTGGGGHARPQGPPAAAGRPPPPPPPPPVRPASPTEMLRALEEAQRKEVAALKAMVELLIEKGVFTREEYLAKLRR